MIKQRALLLASLAAIALALAGCAPSGSGGIEGSRHTLYESLDGLSADSGAVVIGTVGKQSVVDGDLPHTVSVLEVSEALSPARLGTGLSTGAVTTQAGSTIEVRQIGSTALSATPAPLLEEGVTYLLFLTPTMIPGESASQFYVTGAEAGIYRLQGSTLTDDSTFTRVSPDSGDTLPSDLSSSALRG